MNTEQKPKIIQRITYEQIKAMIAQAQPYEPLPTIVLRYNFALDQEDLETLENYKYISSRSGNFFIQILREMRKIQHEFFSQSNGRQLEIESNTNEDFKEVNNHKFNQNNEIFNQKNYNSEQTTQQDNYSQNGQKNKYQYNSSQGIQQSITKENKQQTKTDGNTQDQSQYYYTPSSNATLAIQPTNNYQEYKPQIPNKNQDALKNSPKPIEELEKNFEQTQINQLKKVEFEIESYLIQSYGFASLNRQAYSLNIIDQKSLYTYLNSFRGPGVKPVFEKCRRIFWLVNQNNSHWVLLETRNCGHFTDKNTNQISAKIQILIYDSLGCNSPSTQIEGIHFQKYVEFEYMQCPDLYSAPVVQFEATQVPRQNNGYDCGVFMLQFAQEFLFFGKITTNTYTQTHINNYRKFLQSLYLEIGNKKPDQEVIQIISKAFIKLKNFV